MQVYFLTNAKQVMNTAAQQWVAWIISLDLLSAQIKNKKKDVDSVSFADEWTEWTNKSDNENIFETLHQ